MQNDNDCANSQIDYKLSDSVKKQIKNTDRMTLIDICLSINNL